MRHPKHLLLCTALLLPMTLLSCDDSKTPTDVSVDNAADNSPDLASLTTVGFGSKWHDPHISGATVEVFDGTTDTKNGESGDCDPSPDAVRLCDYGGQAQRFKSKDGAEINTQGSTAKDGAYGGITGKKNLIAGKLLTKVKELDFSYSGGGPVGGSPRFSIPIDECSVQVIGTVQPYTCETDGKWDQFIFADATDGSGCNDGDGFVGVLNGEDDETCTWYLNGTIPYANWHAFADDPSHAGWRIATDTPPFVVVDQPGHYLLFKWDVR